MLQKGNTNDIYNIGNGATWYFGDIIKYAHKKLLSKGTVTHVTPKDFQKQVVVQSFYMNTEKLKALGYRPNFTGERLYSTLCEEQ